MTFEKGDTGFEMMSDYFRMMRKYFTLQPGQDYWSDLVRDVGEFSRKYNTEEDHFPSRIATLLILHADCQQRGTLPYCAAWDGSVNLLDAMVDRMTKSKEGE